MEDAVRAPEAEREPGFLSVIVPVYNAAAYLGDALISVLEEHHECFEIIIVDDGSTDDSAEVAKAFGPIVRYYWQPNRGPAAARNRGLEVAGGAVIAFVDADDRWCPGRLGVMLSALAADASTEVVIGQTQRQELRAANGARTFEDIGPAEVIPSIGSAIYRRSVFERVGRFDEALRYAEDDDWFQRANELGVQIRVLHRVTQYYRIHDRNMTHDVKARQRGRAKFLIRLLKRRVNRRCVDVEP
jgi:glycosyltransferase involved in cell wall biosynthesis